MHILKKIAYVLATLLTLASLSLFIAITPFVVHLEKEETVSRWIQRSGLYENLGQTILDSVGQEEQPGLLGGQAIANITANSLPPAYIREITERVLSATYQWLNGTTAELNFTVDISDREQVFVDQTVIEFKKSAANAPDCTPEQSASFDPGQDSCVPPELRNDAELTKYIASSLTGEPTKKDDFRFDFQEFVDEQAIDRNLLNQVPLLYLLVNLLPVLLGLISVIGALMLFLFGNHVKVLKRIGYKLIVVGLFTGAGWLLTLKVIQTQAEKGVDDAVSEIGLQFINAATMTISQTAFVIVAMYLIIGLSCLGIRYLLLHQKSSKKPAELSPVENTEHFFSSAMAKLHSLKPKKDKTLPKDKDKKL